jgi:hypothetical protein
MPASPADYKNTIGFDTISWLAEPGVLTADSKQDCGENKSCWPISPDVQQKLVVPDKMGFDLREDAWLFFTMARAKFVVDGTTIEVEAQKDHSWIVLMRGRNPGDGDLNLPVTVSNYDVGFGLGTNLPVGARVSENYFKDNAKDAHTQGNCGNDGCKAVSALLYDVNTKAWVVITQPDRNAAWQLVKTNIAK